MKPIILAFLFFSSLVVGIEVPYLSGPIVDEVGLLTPSEVASLEGPLAALNRSRRAQMAVLIVSSLQGESIESFSIAVADQWKLGEKGKDQGIILVVAPRDRKMRIEVGRGLEGEIPDITAKRILSNRVAPLFREKRYYDGVQSAIVSIASILKITEGLPEEETLPLKTIDSNKKVRFLPFLIFFVFFPLLLLMKFINAFTGTSYGHRRYRSQGWGSHAGGFSGGGWHSGSGRTFGGGGGGFGGGGASSSW